MAVDFRATSDLRKTIHGNPKESWNKTSVYYLVVVVGGWVGGGGFNVLYLHSSGSHIHEHCSTGVGDTSHMYTSINTTCQVLVVMDTLTWTIQSEKE